MADTKWVVDLNLDGNELQNAVIQNLGSAPANPKAGQIWYDTSTNLIYYYDGTTSKAVGYLPIASSSVLGGIKVGSNLTINPSTGELSIADASESAKGVIEIATDTEASTGTDTVRAINAKQLATKVSKNSDIVAGTATKITYDSKGLVTAGSSLSASDIPDISATYVPQTSVGVANGVASLNNDGKVPSTQLPSYVDDVIDSYIVSGATALSAGWLSATDGGSALTPETGKIYVVLTDGAYKNKTYRWSGTTYVEISASPGQATESAAGIAELATQTEVNTGTDDQRIVTPLKLAVYVNGMTKKITASNGALTSSSGICTWTISNTLSTADVEVRVYEILSGETVIPEVSTTSSTITIKINSASNIAANTYRAVIIG